LKTTVKGKASFSICTVLVLPEHVHPLIPTTSFFSDILVNGLFTWTVILTVLDATAASDTAQK
jgi:hypothetical protein